MWYAGLTNFNLTDKRILYHSSIIYERLTIDNYDTK